MKEKGGGGGGGNEITNETKHQTEYRHVLKRDEKEERSKQGQTNNKAKP